LEAPPHQKRHQATFPDQRRQARELFGPFFRQRAHRVPGIDTLGRERRTHGLFGDPAIHALRLKVACQSRGTAAAASLGGRVVDRKARVVEQPGRAETLERGIHGIGGMLFLEQAAPQIEARMGATGDRPLRRSVGCLHVRQLL